jgi:hypothetical protein
MTTSAALRFGSCLVLAAAWSGPTRPAARSGHALVYDLVREQVVLVNGDHVGTDVKKGEAWAWDGSAWTLFDTSGPPPRTLSAVAYDRRRKQLVLQGGLGAGDAPESRCGDTWTFDGKKWKRAATDGPGVRNHHAMAFDETRGVVVLFGGQDGAMKQHADTWTWDGKAWKRAAPAGPSARVHHSMAWDAARERIVLFGGTNASGELGDTWTWDGKAWSEVKTPGPPSISHPRLVNHLAHERVYLVGGNMRSPTAWTFDGATWEECESAPPARVVHALAYDEARERIVCFGGYGGGVNLDDTWELVEDRWVRADPKAEGAGGP